MVHLYMGDGKGKTTAAAGLAIRAAGRGMRVCFAQFMKSRDTGELNVLQSLPQVVILRSQKEFGFFSSMSQADKEELTGIHNNILDRLLQMAAEHSCDLIVLDEVTYPVNWGLLDCGKLKKLLDFGKTGEKKAVSPELRQGLEIVLTGRNPADFLAEQADYLTEMLALRHPYEKGVQAREGIEY